MEQNKKKILQHNDLQIVSMCVCIYVKTNEGGESSHLGGYQKSIFAS